MTAIRRSTFAAIVLLSLFISVAQAKEKPEIVRLDAEYTEKLVKINVHWQSVNPVTFIRAIVGKELKELKVDEYDNRRNPDGYTGEAVIVVNAAPVAGVDGISYVVQVEDDIRQKSEQVMGSVRNPAGLTGTEVVTYPGTAGTGAGTLSASGAWTAGGTGSPPSGSWPAAGTVQGGSGTSSGGGAQTGGATRSGSGGWSAGTSGGTDGGSQAPGDAWSKARQGKPGELIDKTIGLVSGTGRSTGDTAGAPASSPSSTGKGGANLPQTLQNEKFGAGGKASFVNGLNPGDEVAVVLGPISRPFTVMKVFFLFGGSTGNGFVTLKVSQDLGSASEGAVLFTTSFEAQGSDTALQEIDLAQVGGVVPISTGYVRVSIQMGHAGLPGIGYDTSANAVTGRNWINRSGAWSDFGTAGIPGNGIIRAMVSQ